MAGAYRFVILDPRKEKRAWLAALLEPLGSCRWLAPAPMSPRAWPETEARVEAALAAAIRQPKGAGRAAKRQLLRWQYNGARALFARDPEAVAVCWNGTNGTRRAFCDGARDAGARVLQAELAPLPGRLTLDHRGINAGNSLPRDIAFYRRWLSDSGREPEAWRAVGAAIRQRAPAAPPAAGEAARPMTEPFLFVPLQVPGDSQLRIYGGAFRTVEAFVSTLARAATSLPPGWHLRLKEHPSGPAGVAEILRRFHKAPVVLDNATDTFAQVAASRGVVTVNSSVGLEAMWFDKPVAACGETFWALEGVATPAPDEAALRGLFSAPERLTFEPAARAAFLGYIDAVYYPRRPTAETPPGPEDLAKVRAQIDAARSV
ncbi:capsular biosynthesis protein [Pseudoroseicyclus tamaricis]|uniref:Capsular biosynthesis protein n=1 Tax=Pseudoroseicyclus tamaricis TaxID=2705421 RepID=A0A6B2JPR8_9RHOB|nr:capsular biosynthesis protein [Pseudoroseicyclus tamaricis]NDU99954.1 capsular biosynthesis protein [Pseudoroseicyclus tamaricis]